MEVTQQLRQLGLNQSEIKIYLFLLANGVSTPPIVSRQTNIARTNCYNILNDLLAKGLVEEKDTGSRKSYLAKDPESLIASLDQKRELAFRIIPDLRAIYTGQKNKPVIRYFEGLAGIKQVYDLALKAKTIYEFVSVDMINSTIAETYKNFVSQIENNAIIHRQIKASDSKTQMVIWDDNAAFITLDDKPFATILKDQSIASTFTMLFGNLQDNT